MKESVVAAIVAAVNAYMEQEAPVQVAPARVASVPSASSWRAFGRHEAIRARTHWHVRRRK